MRRIVPIAFVLIGLAAASREARAQTDYYNTDRGRPLQTEDAYPVERRAFEIQAAPLRVERASGGAYHWSIEPEIAYGILPRTQIEVGVPFSFVEQGSARTSGVSGLHLSALYNLNVETRLPALALSASALLPVGALAPDEPYFSLRGIATRTFTWARFHLNGEYTVGDEVTGASDELSRWSAGIAVDRTFPLESLLIGAELVASQPLDDAADVRFATTIGTRYQLTPRWALDAGIGRHLTGDNPSWFLTLGSAFAVGLPWHPRGAR